VHTKNTGFDLCCLYFTITDTESQCVFKTQEEDNTSGENWMNLFAFFPNIFATHEDDFSVPHNDSSYEFLKLFFFTYKGF